MPIKCKICQGTDVKTYTESSVGEDIAASLLTFALTSVANLVLPWHVHGNKKELGLGHQVIYCNHCKGKLYWGEYEEISDEEAAKLKKVSNEPMTNEQIKEFLRSVWINHPDADEFFIKNPQRIHEMEWIRWWQKKLRS